MNHNDESQNDEFKRYLPDQEPLDQDKLSIEIPAQPYPASYDRVPSGYDPMGEIQLRGRVFRGMASGQAAWWVLITAWVIFGFVAAVMLHAAIATSSIIVWLLLAIAVIPLIVLSKGTAAKLLSRSRRI